MPSRRHYQADLKVHALVPVFILGTVLHGSVQAQNRLLQAQEAAARDMSNWVQFPPRNANSVPSPLPPTSHPQPVPPVVTTGTTVDTRGWLTYTNPEFVRAKPKVESLAPPAELPPTIPAPPPAAPVPTIKRFEFMGNSVYPSEVLETHVTSWLGKPIELTDLQQASETISALYRQDGWLAKVVLPTQDLTDGLVKIQVIEAVLSAVDIQSSPAASVKPEIPRELVAHDNPLNQPLSLKKLERASQLISELPGVESQISLRPGNQPGETEAVISLGENKPHDGAVMVDNGGSLATGTIRTTAQASLKGLFARGDLTSLQISKSQGLSSGRLSYSEPLGGSGLRGGVYASVAHYQLALPGYSELHVHGPSNTLGLELMYPWLRNANHSMNWTASYEKKRYQNYAEGQLASDYSAHVLNTGLNGQFQDFLHGTHSASVLFNIGYLDLSNSLSESKDALGPKTAGMFNKTRLQWIRQQRLNSVDAFQLNLQSQWASKNLDGSEKIFLGGPQGVRAYPVNEAGASAGHVLNAEWFRQVDWVDDVPLTLSIFKDVGYAKVYKYTWSPDGLDKYALRGHGLSIGTSIRSGLGQSQLKLTWAKRLGLNPVARGNSQTPDQDGTLSINRFWLSLSHYF